jgi:beta-phosphoglucomutase family hydrolase
MVGLPDTIVACLFDLDGVLTETATIHAAAWKETFDPLLQERARLEDRPVQPFDAVTDYDAYVDGLPREDGVRTFLASRGITLEEGTPDDPPTSVTVQGIARRKNELFLRELAAQGVTVFPGSLRFLERIRSAGVRCAVVSSSANCRAVLEAGRIDGMFDARVDGLVAARRGLRGKPAPDTYLAAASDLGVPPGRAAVFEDALAGVEAGRAGRFGWVVGVDRMGQAEALRAHGADRVVADLGELVGT